MVKNHEKVSTKRSRSFRKWMGPHGNYDGVDDAEPPKVLIVTDRMEEITDESEMGCIEAIADESYLSPPEMVSRNRSSQLLLSPFRGPSKVKRIDSRSNTTAATTTIPMEDADNHHQPGEGAMTKEARATSKTAMAEMTTVDPTRRTKNHRPSLFSLRGRGQKMPNSHQQPKKTSASETLLPLSIEQADVIPDLTAEATTTATGRESGLPTNTTDEAVGNAEQRNPEMAENNNVNRDDKKSAMSVTTEDDGFFSFVNQRMADATNQATRTFAELSNDFTRSFTFAFHHHLADEVKPIPDVFSPSVVPSDNRQHSSGENGKHTKTQVDVGHATLPPIKTQVSTSGGNNVEHNTSVPKKKLSSSIEPTTQSSQFDNKASNDESIRQEMPKVKASEGKQKMTKKKFASADVPMKVKKSDKKTKRRLRTGLFNPLHRKNKQHPQNSIAESQVEQLQSARKEETKDMSTPEKSREDTTPERKQVENTVDEKTEQSFSDEKAPTVTLQPGKEPNQVRAMEDNPQQSETDQVSTRPITETTPVRFNRTLADEATTASDLEQMSILTQPCAPNQVSAGISPIPNPHNNTAKPWIVEAYSDEEPSQSVVQLVHKKGTSKGKVNRSKPSWRPSYESSEIIQRESQALLNVEGGKVEEQKSFPEQFFPEHNEKLEEEKFHTHSSFMPKRVVSSKGKEKSSGKNALRKKTRSSSTNHSVLSFRSEDSDVVSVEPASIYGAYAAKGRYEANVARVSAQNKPCVSTTTSEKQQDTDNLARKKLENSMQPPRQSQIPQAPSNRDDGQIDGSLGVEGAVASSSSNLVPTPLPCETKACPGGNIVPVVESGITLEAPRESSNNDDGIEWMLSAKSPRSPVSGCTSAFQPECTDGIGKRKWKFGLRFLSPRKRQTSKMQGTNNDSLNVDLEPEANQLVDVDNCPSHDIPIIPSDLIEITSQIVSPMAKSARFEFPETVAPVQQSPSMELPAHRDQPHIPEDLIEITSLTNPSTFEGIQDVQAERCSPDYGEIDASVAFNGSKDYAKGCVGEKELQAEYRSPEDDNTTFYIDKVERTLSAHYGVTNGDWQSRSISLACDSRASEKTGNASAAEILKVLKMMEDAAWSKDQFSDFLESWANRFTGGMMQNEPIDAIIQEMKDLEKSKKPENVAYCEVLLPVQETIAMGDNKGDTVQTSVASKNSEDSSSLVHSSFSSDEVSESDIEYESQSESSSSAEGDIPIKALPAPIKQAWSDLDNRKKPKRPIRMWSLKRSLEKWRKMGQKQKDENKVDSTTKQDLLHGEAPNESIGHALSTANGNTDETRNRIDEAHSPEELIALAREIVLLSKMARLSSSVNRSSEDENNNKNESDGDVLGTANKNLVHMNHEAPVCHTDVKGMVGVELEKTVVEINGESSCATNQTASSRTASVQSKAKASLVGSTAASLANYTEQKDDDSAMISQASRSKKSHGIHDEQAHQEEIDADSKKSSTMQSLRKSIESDKSFISNNSKGLFKKLSKEETSCLSSRTKKSLTSNIPEQSDRGGLVAGSGVDETKCGKEVIKSSDSITSSPSRRSRVSTRSLGQSLNRSEPSTQCSLVETSPSINNDNADSNTDMRSISSLKMKNRSKASSDKSVVSCPVLPSSTALTASVDKWQKKKLVAAVSVEQKMESIGGKHDDPKLSDNVVNQAEHGITSVTSVLSGYSVRSRIAAWEQAGGEASNTDALSPRSLSSKTKLFSKELEAHEMRLGSSKEVVNSPTSKSEVEDGSRVSGPSYSSFILAEREIPVDEEGRSNAAVRSATTKEFDHIVSESTRPGINPESGRLVLEENAACNDEIDSTKPLPSPPQVLDDMNAVDRSLLPAPASLTSCENVDDRKAALKTKNEQHDMQAVPKHRSKLFRIWPRRREMNKSGMKAATMEDAMGTEVVTNKDSFENAAPSTHACVESDVPCLKERTQIEDETKNPLTSDSKMDGNLSPNDQMLCDEAKSVTSVIMMGPCVSAHATNFSVSPAGDHYDDSRSIHSKNSAVVSHSIADNADEKMSQDEKRQENHETKPESCIIDSPCDDDKDNISTTKKGLFATLGRPRSAGRNRAVESASSTDAADVNESLDTNRPPLAPTRKTRNSRAGIVAGFVDRSSESSVRKSTTTECDEEATRVEECRAVVAASDVVISSHDKQNSNEIVHHDDMKDNQDKEIAAVSAIEGDLCMMKKIVRRPSWAIIEQTGCVDCEVVLVNEQDDTTSDDINGAGTTESGQFQSFVNNGNLSVVKNHDREHSPNLVEGRDDDSVDGVRNDDNHVDVANNTTEDVELRSVKSRRSFVDQGRMMDATTTSTKTTASPGVSYHDNGTNQQNEEEHQNEKNSWMKKMNVISGSSSVRSTPRHRPAVVKDQDPATILKNYTYS